MSFTFDGPNKLIICSAGTTSFTAPEIYSRWKDWVLIDDNSKYEIAFRSVAGDPITATQSISPYIFLNTVAGWKIRPQEADHYLSIAGNLYSEDPNVDMFVPTLGGYKVTVQIDRSSSSITTAISGSGSLTTQQETMLIEMYKLMGLDPTKPLVVSSSFRRVPTSGADINQSITDVTGTITVQRL